MSYFIVITPSNSMTFADTGLWNLFVMSRMIDRHA